MKKLIAIAVLGLAAVTSWGQGTVDFRNGGVTFKTATANRYIYFGNVGPGAGTPVPGSADANRVVGTSYVAGLWYVNGADQGGQIASARAVGRTFAFRAATTAEANKGTWVVAAGASPTFTFTDLAIGQSATLQVRVWDSAKFTTFEAAVAGGEFGASAPFNYTVPAAGSAADAYYLDNLRAFAVIPEPSTIALGILGAASLLFLRRRK
jgi:hypothetical protein